VAGARRRRLGSRGLVACRGRRGAPAWEAAWGDSPTGAGFFQGGLLADDRVAFLAGREHGRIVAGASASLGADVVGLGNVFDAGDDLAAAWAAAAALAGETWSGRRIVSYDHGDARAAAQRAGFEPIGALRVWNRPR
jgi:hypothetical protein